MGEIIKFDFNKNRKEDSEKNKSANEQKKWWEEDKQLPLMFVKFFKFLISEESKKIKNLKTTPESLKQARETVRNYTTFELVKWIETSSEKDWQIKPSFFNAVLEELKIRSYDKSQWIDQQ